MTERDVPKTPLAPWTAFLPAGWSVSRLDAVADVLFSNVDKHTIEGELAVRLCNYVDVYKNEYITSTLEFMEATADEREIEKFQIHKGDVLATKDSEEADDIAIPALVAENLPGVICGYHLALIRPRSRRITGEFLAWVHRSKQVEAVPCAVRGKRRRCYTVWPFAVHISVGVDPRPAAGGAEADQRLPAS